MVEPPLTPSAAERAVERALHVPHPTDDEFPIAHCFECDRQYPCPTIRLLDDLERAEAALRDAVTHCPACYGIGYIYDGNDRSYECGRCASWRAALTPGAAVTAGEEDGG